MAGGVTWHCFVMQGPAGPSAFWQVGVLTTELSRRLLNLTE